MKILIIDDDATMRLILKKNLEKYIPGCFFTEGSTGLEAVKAFRQLQPDLTFLDIEMPEKNGFYALKKIRMMDANAKVIMCSGDSSQENVIEALRYRVLDFVIKPYTPERLLQALEKANL
ncbi:MAG: response regulator [Lachnospiraceae bacterium]|nr:response regulator [Lachnospiraceae bacterium]